MAQTTGVAGQRPLTTEGRALWIIFATALFGTSCSVALRDEIITAPALAATVAGASAALMAAGFYMTRDARGRRTGLAVALVGSVWPLDFWAIGGAGIGPTVAWVLGGARWIALVYVGLTYPADLPEAHNHRNLLRASALLFGPGNLLLVALSRPEWNGFDKDSWWPGVLASHGAYLVASSIYGLGCLAIALSCGFIMLDRLRAAARVDRLVLFPSLIGMIIVGIIAATAKAIQAVLLTGQAWTLCALATVLGMLAVPGSLLWSSARFRIARSSVVETITRLSHPATVDTVRTALRAALRDETLDVLLWSAERGSLLPGPGRTEATQVQRSPFESRAAIPVLHRDGSRLAYITTDPRLQVYPEMLQAAMAAARFPLENARMNAELQAALQETRESRTRILEAQAHERRRLERNLHDGAQQRMLALGLQLEQLRLGTREPETEELILALKANLRGAINEIRDISRGLHPAALQEGGLRASLESVASGLPFETQIDVDVAELAPAHESAVYYVVCEALANAAKHAAATRVEVNIASPGDAPTIVVVDNGRGGAALGTLGGLRGMADRVSALGGSLALDSPPGNGTTLRVRLPVQSRAVGLD